MSTGHKPRDLVPRGVTRYELARRNTQLLCGLDRGNRLGERKGVQASHESQTAALPSDRHFCRDGKHDRALH